MILEKLARVFRKRKILQYFVGFLALVVLANSRAFARDACITAVFKASFDSNVGCKQSGPNLAFAHVNGTAVLFNVVPESVVCSFGKELSATSIGCFSNNILVVGQNNISIKYLYGNGSVATINGTAAATFTLEKGRPNERVLCTAFFWPGSANGFGCQATLNLSLSEVHPELVTEIESLQLRSKQLEQELKQLEDDDLSTDDLRSALDSLLSRGLEYIGPEDVLAISKRLSGLAETVRSLKVGADSTRKILQNQLDGLSVYLSETRDAARKELTASGIRIDDPSLYQAAGIRELTFPALENLGLLEEGKTAVKKTAYSNLCDRASQRIKEAVRNRNWAEANLTIDAWSETVSTLAQSLKSHGNSSKNSELRAFNNSVMKVRELIQESFDEFGFLKNSKLSQDIKQTVARDIAPRDRDRARKLRDALNSWESEAITPQQSIVLDTVKGLGAGYQILTDIPGGTDETKQRLGEILDETIEVAKKVARIGVGFTPLGKFVDFCEVITGKSGCIPGGEELTLRDRALSAVGIALGSGEFWRKLGTVLIGPSVRSVTTRTAGIVGSIEKAGVKATAAGLKANVVLTREICKIMQPHIRVIKTLDPSAKVGIRGSLIRGIQHKGGGPFNPNKFDVDAFIVSDKLAARFSPGKWFKPGTGIEEIEQIQILIQKAVVGNPLFKGQTEPFCFRIIETKKHAYWLSKADCHILLME